MVQRQPRPAVALIALLLLAMVPLMPSSLVEVASAQTGNRHVYTFADGSTERVTLYQGASPDRTTSIRLPVGAEVTDVEMTLSGASATGWSQWTTDDRSAWMRGTAWTNTSGPSVDARSDDLTLGMVNPSEVFLTHGEGSGGEGSTAYLHTGTSSLRQPHTSNATESLYSAQSSQTSSSFMAQSQGAIAPYHDWLYLSTWTSSTFSNIVHRLHPSNATLDSIITLEREADCTLPQLHSSTYYGMYGFRDWTFTDDERMFGILSGYRYFYGTSAPVQYHRVLEFDVRYDDVWTCTDSYDVQAQYGDYTGIAYDRDRELVWIAHNQQRKIVSYTFEDGSFERGEDVYTFASSSNSLIHCGRTSSMVRGLEVTQNTFHMRCMKGQYYNDQDQISGWNISSGTSTALLPRTSVRDISALGHGLVNDGERLHTMDAGYSTWSGKTLYHREFGTGIQYPTTPAPGSTIWYGAVITSDEDIVAVNMETHWSATSVGDRVDYWISADNGTHWEAVTSNTTIHFSNPGRELVWKANLIGSTATSWWVEIEHATEYRASGEWTSPIRSTGTVVGKVRPVWTEHLGTGSTLEVHVSNDAGANFSEVTNGMEHSFSTQGSQLQWRVMLSTSDGTSTPSMDGMILWYEEGYPDRPRLDVGDDDEWDWISTQFLNESSVTASDDSVVGQEVLAAPSLVDAFNDHIPQNGVGTVDVPIAVKAASSGRVKLSALDITYRLRTRALDATMESSVLAPDGDQRLLIVRAAPGDDVMRIEGLDISLTRNVGDRPTFSWSIGGGCSGTQPTNASLTFDHGNCTSSTASDGTLTVRMPMTSDWSWDDQSNVEAIMSVRDDAGPAVDSWTTSSLRLRIENDIQLDGMQVVEETGRQLSNFEWVRGGYNLTVTGGIHFQSTSLSPTAGQFKLQVHGQNVSQDGDPIGVPVLLHEEWNPAHGQYSMTFPSPMESMPGGMVLSVVAAELPEGSTFVNPSYNTIRLIFDGNSPLVLMATPLDGSEIHRGPPSPGGQSISIVVQDSVDPPTQLTVHYWIGCSSQDVACSDTDFNGLPSEVEYRETIFTTPEIQPGGLNIFQGLIDDSMLNHGQKVSIYVSGADGQGNTVAMGGGPVCPDGPPFCGFAPGEVQPDWGAPLTTYTIREEFEPELIASNSTIQGHVDRAPLHPGIPYTARIQVADRNGWDDLRTLELALGGDFDDPSQMIRADLIPSMDDGPPTLSLASGGSGLAVSNLYSSVAPDPDNASLLNINIRFQLTWTFDESWDTDGTSHFIPKVRITDAPCNEREQEPCHTVRAGLGNDLWSLDNDLRFSTSPGTMRAIEFRDGTNHWTDTGTESPIGAGQAIRFSGRVLFSEDDLAPPDGIFTVELSDFEHRWTTTTHDGGRFDIDFLVPAVQSGHLDLRARLVDLPGLASDETDGIQRLRLAVDREAPVVGGVDLGNQASGGAVPLSTVDDLFVTLDLRDDAGFALDQSVAFNYVITAGAMEIARGTVPFTDVTPFADQTFWQGRVDLTDGGATVILPSYSMSVWITGSDRSGNPFLSEGNSEEDPVGVWSFALSGPMVDLDADADLAWIDPSPRTGDTASLDVRARNTGADGNLRFELQRYDGAWRTVDAQEAEVGAGEDVSARLAYLVQEEPGDFIEFRVVVYDGPVEMDRLTVPSLIVTEVTLRDGAALAAQVQQGQLSLVLYLIALGSIGYAVWMMMVNRRLLAGDDEDEADMTALVSEGDGKVTPEIPMTDSDPHFQSSPLPSLSPSGPAVPPTGLPPGWTQEQWMHYGHQYIQSHQPPEAP